MYLLHLLTIKSTHQTSSDKHIQQTLLGRVKNVVALFKREK